MLSLEYPWIPADDVRPIACCLCGGVHTTETVFEFMLNGKRFAIEACSGDGLMFLSPQPGARYATALYEHPSYFTGEDDMYGLATTPENGRRIGEIRGEEIAVHAPQARSMLEVGCGLGYTMEAVKERGIRVVGVEFSEAAVAACSSRNLEVFAGAIAHPVSEDVRLRAPFDIIALYSVLEHVPEPLAFLAELVPLVARNGHMVIRVPRMSREGPWLSLLDHFWHFTQDSLVAVMKKSGLQPIDIFDSGIFVGRIHGGELKSMTIFARTI